MILSAYIIVEWIKTLHENFANCGFPISLLLASFVRLINAVYLDESIKCLVKLHLQTKLHECCILSRGSTQFWRLQILNVIILGE